MTQKITSAHIRDGDGSGAGTKIVQENGALLELWSGKTVQEIPLTLAAAAPKLLAACKKVVASHYASNKELERAGVKRNKLPLCSIICQDAIAEAEGK